MPDWGIKTDFEQWYKTQYGQYPPWFITRFHPIYQYWLKMGKPSVRMTPETSRLSQQIGEPVIPDTPDSLERKAYLTKLAQWLSIKVGNDLMSPEEAQALYNSTEKAVMARKPGINPRGDFASGMKELDIAGSLPFMDEIPANDMEFKTKLRSGQQEVRQKQIERTNKIAGQSDYLGQLGAMLNRKASKGEITQEQANQVMSKEKSDIAEGISPKASPNFSRVQEYFQNMQVQVEGMKPSRRDQALLDAGVSPAEHFRTLTEQQTATGRSSDTVDYQAWQARQQPLASAWEQQKQRTLQDNSGNYGWIKKWIAAHTENPYVTTRQQQNERDVAWNWIASRPDLKQILAENPGLPLTPDWLAKMTGLKTGQPLEKAPLSAPSGQQWASMLPSEQQKWAGYADWSGAGAEDLLTRMEQMRPNTPRIAWNWSPARARV